MNIQKIIEYSKKVQEIFKYLFQGKYVYWNLSIADTLGPGIFGHFLVQYRSFPLSVVKNVLVTPFGTKMFVLIMEVFSIESLIWRVC